MGNPQQPTGQPYQPPQPPQPPYGQPTPPLPRRRGMPTWGIVLIAVGGAVAVLCAGLVVLAFALPEDDQDASADPTGPATVAAQADDLAITVTDVTRAEAEVGDRVYTIVAVEVVNESDDRIYVGPLDWHITDADGHRHDVTFGPGDDELPGLRLNPGDSTAGTFAVEGELEVATVVYQRWPSDDPIEVPAA